VRGDKDRLQQVLWNLLSNAIKFTPAGGNVTLRLDGSAAGVELSVRDDGAGIPPEFLPHLFGRFRQAQPALTRDEGGLGLGLAIARALDRAARRHHPRLERRAGARLALRRRAAAGRHPRAASPLVLPPELPGPVQARPAFARDVLRGRTVLVVEDDPDARELLGLTLEEFGATVRDRGQRRPGNGSAAGRPVRRADERRLDAGEDGYSFVTRARAAGFALPKVALTANAPQRRPRPRAGRRVRGARHKPVEPQELAAVLLRVLQG